MNFTARLRERTALTRFKVCFFLSRLCLEIWILLRATHSQRIFCFRKKPLRLRRHDFKSPSPCGRDLGRGYRNGNFVISIFYNPPPNPLRKGGGIFKVVFRTRGLPRRLCRLAMTLRIRIYTTLGNERCVLHLFYRCMCRLRYPQSLLHLSLDKNKRFQKKALYLPPS